MALDPEVVAHIRYPEGEGNGRSYYTFHGGIPPPLPTTVVNEMPPPPLVPADGAQAATVKEEMNPNVMGEADMAGQADN